MFAKAYEPQLDLDVDEVIIKFLHDTSLLKQYMPLMPTKKVWVAVESTISYFSMFEIYAGKNNFIEYGSRHSPKGKILS